VRSCKEVAGEKYWVVERKKTFYFETIELLKKKMKFPEEKNDCEMKLLGFSLKQLACEL
jgi:hypothetical protein